MEELSWGTENASAASSIVLVHVVYMFLSFSQEYSQYLLVAMLLALPAGRHVHGVNASSPSLRPDCQAGRSEQLSTASVGWIGVDDGMAGCGSTKCPRDDPCERTTRDLPPLTPERTGDRIAGAISSWPKLESRRPISHPMDAAEGN